MKRFAFILTLVFSLVASSASALTLKTKCNENDCFFQGWVTTGRHFRLETTCKQADCARFGWQAKVSDGSTYDVVCKAGGCFTEGWYSTQKWRGIALEDEVSCQREGCLVGGWDVKSSYSAFGGKATCKNSDCSTYGGKAIWRGGGSETFCHRNDCYHYGWDLKIHGASGMRLYFM